MRFLTRIGAIAALIASVGASLTPVVPAASATALRSHAGASSRNAADVTFARLIYLHHLGAIQMTVDARSRATGATKSLAALIDTQQTADLPVIRGLLKQWGLPTTTASMRHTKGTAADQAAMAAGMTNAEMKSLKMVRKGTAFDKRFLSQMIIHHGGAVKLAEIELADGKSSAAKAFAKKVASSQSKQIVVMRHLLATL